MTIKEQLDADLRDAMRSGDDARRTTLRLLLTSIRNAEIPPEAPSGGSSVPQRIDLDDEVVLGIIRKEVKQRRDSIEAYSKANRPDLVAKEEAEVTILSVYLPQQMSREEIAAVVRGIIEKTGAKGPADKGKVMPAAMAELRDRAEGREINAVVTELLSALS